MKWSELTVHTTSEGAELVSNVFFEMGANGVVVEDRNDVIAALTGNKMWDYVDEKLLGKSDGLALVKGFVQQELEPETKRELQQRLRKLDEQAASVGVKLGSLEVISRELDDEDWVNVWKRHYKPLHLGKVVVCPEWIPYVAKGDERIVKIDPGMAFGTGEHETTEMCIQLLQHCKTDGKDVIDVGCGSGILGAAALKLGAKSAYMVDFDPVAVQATKHNLELNQVRDKAKVKCGDLLEDSDVTGDIVFANITADILLRLCKSLFPYVRKGGTIIISGLIHSRVAEVLAAYQAAGFVLDRSMSNGEWNAAAFHREA